MSIENGYSSDNRPTPSPPISPSSFLPYQSKSSLQNSIKNLIFNSNISPIQKEMSLHILHRQQNEILNLSSTSSLPSSPSSSLLSPSPSPSPSSAIKLDQHQDEDMNDRRINVDDEEDDDREIDVDDDNDHDRSIINHPINFSISNILSGNFGKLRSNNITIKRTTSSIFRPYEILNNESSNRKQNNQLTSSLSGLCKTISQIGQFQLHSSNSNSAFSLSNSSLLPLSHRSLSSSINDSGVESSSDETRSESGCSSKDENRQELWPAWVYCTRYSDRPSSGPRYRRPKQPKDKSTPTDDKRPRTAFSSEQLAKLKQEFNENRYLTERRRQQLSNDLGLNEAQIKIWFQNKRAKIKKSTGQKNPLAMQLMAQGLYNHTTVPLTKEEEELELRMNGKL